MCCFLMAGTIQKVFHAGIFASKILFFVNLSNGAEIRFCAYINLFFLCFFVGHPVSHLVHLHIGHQVHPHGGHRNVILTLCEVSETMTEWKSETLDDLRTDWC